MVGGSGQGHGAGASCAGYTNTDLMDSHVATLMPLPTDKLHVSRHVSGEPLTRMLACDIRLFLGRLWDHSRDSCMSLHYP